MRTSRRPSPWLPLLAVLALSAVHPAATARAEDAPAPSPEGPSIGDRLSDWVPSPSPAVSAPAPTPPALLLPPGEWEALQPTKRPRTAVALPGPEADRPLQAAPAAPGATGSGAPTDGTAAAPGRAPSPAAAATRASAARPLSSPTAAVRAAPTARSASPWPSDPVAAPFAGSDLFVGRSMPVVSGGSRYEVGIATQVVPLELVLSANRDALVAQGVTSACAKSTDPACAAQAEDVANQALDVLSALPDSQWKGLVAAAQDPAALAVLLKSYGVTDPKDVQAVQSYVSALPSSKRATAMVLARHLSDGTTAAIRMEPYVNLDLKPLRVRVGVPFQVDSGSSTTSDLGNLSLDVGKGWTFPVRGARLGIGTGLWTTLPTSTSADRPSLMADLFQAPRFVPGYLTLAPYLVAGVDHRWVSLQVHGDLWIQARVRDGTGPADAEVLQYGLGLAVAPHWYVSLLAQLEGVEGLRNADAYRSLFVVAGLQLNLWYVRLGAALQVPVVDRNREDLGTWQGIDVGALAKYSVLTRLSIAF